MACTDDCRRLKQQSALAHCSVCHSTFSGVGSFDFHRHHGVCRTTLMTQAGDGVWRKLPDARATARFARLTANRLN